MTDTSALAGRVIEACVARALTVGVAESLTGGLLAASLVSVPGASRVFRGGVIAYDTALKSSLLGVEGPLLEREGPVHAEVARQMAAGARHACRVDGRLADIGLATTGVAGPDPDPQTGQPAGTVWIAWNILGVPHVERCEMTGDRQRIRTKTVQVLLEHLLLNLSHLDSHSGSSRE